jgi:uncharacterized protein with beta-barrel porin domain
MSATRMEYAMQAIDSQLANGAGGIDGGFIDGAGQFQQITSAAQAVASLRSLSGELHATADAMTFDNITSNRRTLAARFGEIASQTDATGSWYRAVGKPGQNSAGFGNFLRDGWVMGSDARIGPRLLGFAFGETVGNAYDHGDRSRDRQTQAQFYSGGDWGNAYALSQFGAGRYQRQLVRELLLGSQRDYVGTNYAGNFFSANVEVGYRFGAFTPYAGIDYVRLNRDGFVENGGNGFGLQANASSAERTQAVMGLRTQRAWATAGGRKFTLNGYAEWQQSLSENGLLMDVSFVGAQSWSPLYGEGFSRSSGLFGLGLDSRLSRNTTLSFGYDQRVGSAFDDRQWSTKLRYGF